MHYKLTPIHIIKYKGDTHLHQYTYTTYIHGYIAYVLDKGSFSGSNNNIEH